MGRVLQPELDHEVDVPRAGAGVPFLETFGGFLQHCGVLGVGGPSPKDTHPLHGELPNAPYERAYLVLGEDERGAYIGLGGGYRHTVAFSASYLAEPLAKLYAGETLFDVEMTVTNLKASPMELMYLMHVNFKPVDYGRLVYERGVHPRARARAQQHPGPHHSQAGIRRVPGRAARAP